MNFKSSIQTFKEKIFCFLNPDSIIEQKKWEEMLAYHKANIKAIAHHEAGHAVADYFFNIPIEKVTIIPQKDGSTGFVEISEEWKKQLRNDDNTDQIEKYKALLGIQMFCGGAAEAKYRGFPNQETNRTDREIMRSTTIFYPEEYAEKILKIYEDEATRMMEDSIIWSAVQIVAFELIMKKTLCQKELKEICDRVFITSQKR